ncbi:MAG TPA: DNA/RNA non-specific endonuclease [Candidatus Dorea intestinavium]|nr:DNA/RNA non-specific endonuclease [Candidatus Dorea intestinavium]
MKKNRIISTLLLVVLLLVGCASPKSQAPTQEIKAQALATLESFKIPADNGEPYVAVNNNVPYFKESDYTTTSYESYSELDALGRCKVAVANIGKDLMPTEKRGPIGEVKPSGWHLYKYDFVDGKYLYNRCHLIGFQLSGENANEKNLITGTRYLNTQGMLPFENMVADYVKETNNHVLYRVTPIFEGDNLVARGVLMEGMSIEDKGEGICFNVFAYNDQPGVQIDYKTGESSQAEAGLAKEAEKTNSSAVSDYVLNENTKKFHKPTCYSVSKMKAANRVQYQGNREDLIKKGYEACQSCNP